MIEIYKDGVKMTVTEERRYIGNIALGYLVPKMYRAGYDAEEIARVAGKDINIIETMIKRIKSAKNVKN